MFYAGLDAPEKRRFTFPLCCYPIKLRPATIFWIIAISDISYSIFATFIGTMLVLAAPVVSLSQYKVWYFIAAYSLFLVIHLSLIFLGLEITFVKCCSKSREKVIRRCKQYTIAR